MIFFFITFSIIIVASAILSYCNHKWLKLPATIGVMAFSIIIAIALKITGEFYPQIITPLKEHLQSFDFSTFVLNIVLCFLLFAGSLHVNWIDLKNTKSTVLSFATFGTIISTILVSLFAKWILSILGLNVPIIDCLLFGALISPTDPISVMSILTKYNIPPKLKTEIIGESLFNDGVGVVIFTVIYSVMQSGENSVSAAEIIKLFSREVFGGLGIGIIIGYIGYLAIRSIDHYQTEVMITLAIVMGGYTLASILHTSGPLAMVVAGIFIGNNMNEKNMSDTTRSYLSSFWELIDEICNIILFMLIGLEVLIIPFKFNYLTIGLILIALTLIARFISILPIYTILNRGEKNKFLSMQILTWGGLRGGISVALSLSLINRIEYGDLFVVVTFCIVVFSILVQGLTFSRLLEKYK